MQSTSFRQMNKNQKILPTGKTGHGRTMAGGVASCSRRRRSCSAAGQGDAAASTAERSWRAQQRGVEALVHGPQQAAARQRRQRHDRARKLTERARTRRARASVPHLGSI